MPDEPEIGTQVYDPDGDLGWVERTVLDRTLILKEDGSKRWWKTRVLEVESPQERLI